MFLNTCYIKDLFPNEVNPVLILFVHCSLFIWEGGEARRRARSTRGGLLPACWLAGCAGLLGIFQGFECRVSAKCRVPSAELRVPGVPSAECRVPSTGVPTSCRGECRVPSPSRESRDMRNFDISMRELLVDISHV